MLKFQKSVWLFVGAGAMFVAAGAIQRNNGFYSIGAMFVAIGFSRLMKSKK